MPLVVEEAVQVQLAIRTLARIAASWERTKSSHGELEGEASLDEEFLMEMARLAAKREAQSPTSEGAERWHEGGMRALLVSLTAKLASMLKSRKDRRLNRDLLDEVHREVASFGFTMGRATLEAKVTAAARIKFRGQEPPENFVSSFSGAKQCAAFLLGALELAPGTKTSSLAGLQSALKTRKPSRIIRYEELARFLLVCLNVPMELVGPLAELLDKIRTGDALFTGDRCLAEVRRALRITRTPKVRLPYPAYPAVPVGE